MILPSHAVSRPSRYSGGEANAVVKPDADFRVCLAFPDSYEVGMSHLGVKILYGILNSLPGVAAERCFAPWSDAEALLRKTGEPLRTLESGTALRDVNLLGFSLQYELGYTNVLQMLELGGIALHSQDRDDRLPIVIAGGPCTANPVPLIPFIDAFLIGDGEEAVVEIVECLRRNLREPRRQRLAELAGVPGLYVPSVHGSAPAPPIRRRIVENLDAAYFPTRPVVAHQAVHSRVAIEIGRGCPRGCRFCQAGMIYRPLRERSLETILRLADESIRNTGYSDLSFASLSAGDYPCLFPLIQSVNDRLKGRHVAVSLPSLRVGSVDRATFRAIKSERKTGLTIAPEAGTDRLRRVINKDITEAAYLEGLKIAFEEGWETVKLYFMIGLPTETDEDIEGIIKMAKEAVRLAREAKVRRVSVNVGVSTLVPKPHTPFQWQGQIPVDEIRARQEYLRRALSGRAFKLKTHHPQMSLLEAVFSRGTAEVSELLLAAYRRGCRFDGWTEAFNFRRWEEAAEESGVGFEAAWKNYEPEDRLPWDVVDSGIRKSFLRKELGLSLKETMSPECRTKCTGCGLDCPSPPGLPMDEAACGALAGGRRPPAGTRESAPIVHYRVRFSKTGRARYLSHLELKEAIIRALRRAGLSLEYTQGFHPQPKVSFGPALGTGIAGVNEVFDMSLTGLADEEGLAGRITEGLPEGVVVEEVRRLQGDETSLGRLVSRYTYRVRMPEGFAVPEPLVPESLTVVRPPDENRPARSVDIRPLIQGASLSDRLLTLDVMDRGELKVRIHEMLAALLKLPPEAVSALEIDRTGLLGFQNGWISPMESVRRSSG